MNAPKIVIALVWLASAAAWISPWGGWSSTILLWVGPLLVVAHLIEFAIYRKVLEADGGSLVSHFVNTFFFGVLHINEVKARVEGEAPSA